MRTLPWILFAVTSVIALAEAIGLAVVLNQPPPAADPEIPAAAPAAQAPAAIPPPAAPAAPAWEYRTEYFLDPLDGKQYSESAEAGMARLGGEGWELVSSQRALVTASANSSLPGVPSTKCIFKRRR